MNEAAAIVRLCRYVVAICNTCIRKVEGSIQVRDLEPIKQSEDALVLVEVVVHFDTLAIIPSSRNGQKAFNTYRY